VVCAGLAIDGGRLVAAKVKASDTAENAARTGAQALTNLRSGVPQIEPRRAIRLASSYLTSVGVVGQIRASEFEVCVVVRSVESMTLLKLVGLNSKSVSSQRCARAIGG